MPRLYREAPLYSIWEGAGNIQALDVLRAVARTPGAVDAVLEEVDAASGADARLDAAAAELRAELADRDAVERRARRISGLLAAVLQGALLVRHAPSPVADGWCATRLSGGHALYGTLPSGLDLETIIDRATPHPD
jgi:putative acyl-CoA dehydrogenase